MGSRLILLIVTLGSIFEYEVAVGLETLLLIFMPQLVLCAQVIESLLLSWCHFIPLLTSHRHQFSVLHFRVLLFQLSCVLSGEEYVRRAGAFRFEFFRLFITVLGLSLFKKLSVGGISALSFVF